MTREGKGKASRVLKGSLNRRSWLSDVAGAEFLTSNKSIVNIICNELTYTTLMYLDRLNERPVVQILSDSIVVPDSSPVSPTRHTISELLQLRPLCSYRLSITRYENVLNGHNQSSTNTVMP